MRFVESHDSRVKWLNDSHLCFRCGIFGLHIQKQKSTDKTLIVRERSYLSERVCIHKSSHTNFPVVAIPDIVILPQLFFSGIAKSTSELDSIEECMDSLRVSSLSGHWPDNDSLFIIRLLTIDETN